MIRKDQVETQLDLLQQTVERLKTSRVVRQEPGDKGTPYPLIIQQLQQIENQIDQIINLIQLED